ncbi:hypothetical protein [Zavarzinella formosa]|uniref:hypothetical protein n=1 Tax=Zavarzinella formosa TaxID=360055 RepID=UPI0002DE3CD5|nr:hypothetical protein [Zavarzinella formosa]
MDSKAETLEAVKRDDKRLLASDLVRRPRKKIRERLKRHIAFLRELPTLVGSKMRDVTLKRGRETYGYE